MGTSPTRTSTCAAGTSLKAFLAFLDRFVSSDFNGSRLEVTSSQDQDVHRHLKWLCFEYTSPVTVCILGLLGQVHLKCFRAALGQQKESESSLWMDECFRAGRVNGWHSCALLGWPTSLPHGLAGWVDRSDAIHLKLCFFMICVSSGSILPLIP